MPDRPLPAESAWPEALEHLRELNRGVAAEAIGAWCAAPVAVIDRLRSIALTTRQREGLGAGPAIIHFEHRELFSQHRFDEFIRISTREGVFLPVLRLAHGLDTQVDDYEVNPLLIAPNDATALAAFGDKPVVCGVNTSEFDRWISRAPRSKPRFRKKAFVSHVMDRAAESDSLVSRLRGSLLQHAELLVAEDLPASSDWSPAIRDGIRQSDVVVVDISEPTKEILVELGWAVGAERQTVLLARDKRSVKNIPEWLTGRTVRLFGTASEFSESLKEIIRRLDQPPGRFEKWLDNSQNSAIDYKPEVHVVGMIGGGSEWSAASRNVNRAASDYGFLSKVIDVSRLRNDGATLYRAIEIARHAGTLILLFDGVPDDDLLLCMMGGVFTTREAVKIGHAKIVRELVLVEPTNPIKDPLPSLLTKSRLARRPSTLSDAVGLIRQRLSILQKKIERAKKAAVR